MFSIIEFRNERKNYKLYQINTCQLKSEILLEECLRTDKKKEEESKFFLHINLNAQIKLLFFFIKIEEIYIYFKNIDYFKIISKKKFFLLFTCVFSNKIIITLYKSNFYE